MGAQERKKKKVCKKGMLTFLFLHFFTFNLYDLSNEPDSSTLYSWSICDDVLLLSASTKCTVRCCGIVSWYLKLKSIYVVSDGKMCFWGRLCHVHKKHTLLCVPQDDYCFKRLKDFWLVDWESHSPWDWVSGNILLPIPHTNQSFDRHSILLKINSNKKTSLA